MATPILGPSEATDFQLRNFLHTVNPGAPDYSTWYLTLGRKYGIRGDIAFCQSILETNYWRFGGNVLPDQNNFAGLGVTSDGVRGVTFSTPQAGIEAQMQHLYAYATNLPLPANTIHLDPRFDLVTRGSAATWESLSGRWATDPEYGQKIMQIYQQMITSQSALFPPSKGGTTTGSTTSGASGTAPGGTTGSTTGSTAGSTASTSGTASGTTGNTTSTSSTAGGTTGTTTSTPTGSLPQTTSTTTPTSPPVTPGPTSFPDVAPGKWYAPYIQRAAELGLMHGEDDGNFHPDQPATRAELAVALYNLFTLLQNK